MAAFVAGIPMTASLFVGAISAEATRLASDRIDQLLRDARSAVAHAWHLPRGDRGARKTSLLGYTRMLAVAAEQSGRHHLGLDMAREAPQHGIFGDLFAHAPTVGDALAGLVRYFPAIQTGTTVKLEQAHGTARFVYDIHDPSVSDRLQDAAYTLGKISRSLRRSAGDAWTLAQVTMAARAPRSLEAYSHFFGAPVVFDAQATALCFPAALLALPIRSADAQRHAQFCARMDCLMPGAEDPGLLEDALREWLSDAARWGGATLEHAAADFGVTPRTLQRRLKDLGISFLDLRARVRMETARRLLLDSRLPLTHIAEQLGFSEPSAFTRAFRSHARQSPSDFRRSALAAL